MDDVNISKRCNIQDPNKIRTNPIPMIFGMKVMVTSLICVAACTRLIRLPITRLTNKTGPARINITNTAFCARVRTYASVMAYVKKLKVSERVIRYQPSTRMNRRILNGSETSEGGSIIIPMESKMLEITRSITRKGI